MRKVELRAEALARQGNAVSAAAMLATARTAKTTEVRAQLLENAADWAGAARAWSDCAALTLPESGALDEAQTRTVLRLATATARASDDAGLAILRGRFDDRIGPGSLGDMFRLLTAEPVKTTADIGRAQREISLAASMPANLKSLRPETLAR